jgi:hypothetical protein
VTDETNDAPVRVGGQERPHPALRKLGRALIALARHQLGIGTTTEEAAAAPPTDNAIKDQPAERGSEVEHGE